MSRAERAKAIFLEALEKHAPQEWPALLDQACAEDTLLRPEVEKLLAAHVDLGSFHEGARPTIPGTPASALSEGIGAVIGPFRLLEQIGEGGFGAVFLAEQTHPVRRKVALKILKPGMDTRQIVARFEAERQALAIMDHPNIAKVLDGGATPTGRPYFVMDLVKGVPITEFCDQHHLTPRQRLELFIPVCHAVQHAHQKGIIHRDIKPRNVMVAMNDGQPVPKVIDFGVAKATGPQLSEETLHTGVGAIVGTIEYMSPEQAGLNQLDVDTRSDIYSLGVLLYELLTGTPPLDRKRLRETPLLEMLRIIREDDTVRPSARLSTVEELPAIAARRSLEPKKLSGLMRGELDWIVMKALEKDRSRRYETADNLAMDLERYLHDEPVSACPPSAWYRFGKFARRNKAALSLAAGLTLAVLAVAVVASLSALWLNVEQQATKNQLLKTQAAEYQATRNFQSAEKHRQAAEDSAEQHRSLLVRTLVKHGNRLMDEDDLFGALPWFGHALTHDQKDPRRAAVHKARLASILHRGPRLVQCWFHEKPVTRVEFSPDGRRVLTASKDGTARVWRVDSGEPAFRPLVHADWVNDACFSPDGTRLLTACRDGNAAVWNAVTGDSITKFRDSHFGLVSAVFSPDGSRVATAYQKAARVWNATTGESITPPLQHSRQVRHTTFSPDGKNILVACWEFEPPGGHYGEARVWDAHSGEPVTPPLAKNSGVSQAWFLANGMRVVTANTFGPARIWEVPTGKLVMTFQGTMPAESVAVSQDNARVATSDQQGTVQMWSPATGKQVFPAAKQTSGVSRLSFSIADRRFVTCCRDGTARLWDRDTGAKAGPPLHHAGSVTHADFSRDGRLLATGGIDGVVCVWDLERRQDVVFERLMPGFGGRQKARFSPDSRRLLLAGENQPVSVWNLAEGTAVSWLHAPPRAGLPATGTTDGVVQAVFAKDGTSVLTTGYDGTARVWDAATGKPITQLLVHKGIVWDGAFSPDGKYVVTCSQDNSAQVWSVATSQPVTPPLKHSNVTQVCFSPDGKLVLTGGFQSARLWAADTGAPVLAVAVDNLVFSASFSPDGQSFVTASGDGMVRVWNTATGQPVTPAMRHGAGVFMARYSSDGKRLVTASDDAAARVWDATSGAPLGPPLQHKSRVRVAVFSPDDQCVASGGDDGAMRLWDAATGEPMGPPIMHKAGLECVDISPDGRLLVTVTFGRQVCVWRLPAPDKGAADLALFSQLLSASRFDDQGTIVRLEPAHLKAIWLELKAKFPREFGMLAGPTLLTPAAGAAPTRGQTVAQLQQWEFTWAPVPSATAYHLVVATPLTAVPMISDSKIPSHVYRTVARSYGTVQWHWKVRAQVHGIWTSWSEERALPPPKKKGS